jgi:calreticulin
MKMKVIFSLICVFLALSTAKVYFDEDFDDDTWKDRWVVSDWKKSEGTAGDWDISAGKFYGDKDEDKGLRTTQDARFYSISAKTKEFSNKDKDLVLQYRIKHEQNIDCGGGYVKLLPAGIDQEKFNGDTDYNIMFGPDICGSTKRIHVILTYKGKNHLINKNIPCESDELSHLYTLILRPDNTYEVQVDGKEKAKGKLEEDWDFLPPKQIKDPKESKPSDWVDEKEIADPEDKKPEGWDDIPRELSDPSANKPEDWDDDLDGEWEAPMIPNPDYKGEWRAKMIPNPEYKGEWVHPLIDNPDYAPDANIYAFDSNAFLGIEIWQVKSGTIFDDFLVTDSVEEAQKEADSILKRIEAEKAAKEEDDKKKAEEARIAEEARKAEEDAKKASEPAAEDKQEEKEDL